MQQRCGGGSSHGRESSKRGGAGRIISRLGWLRLLLWKVREMGGRGGVDDSSIGAVRTLAIWRRSRCVVAGQDESEVRGAGGSQRSAEAIQAASRQRKRGEDRARSSGLA